MHDIKEYFSHVEFPYSETQFLDEMHRLFFQHTGEHLDDISEVYVEKYVRGGRSSGYVSGAFWIERAIPMLVGRYHKLCNELRG